MWISSSRWSPVEASWTSSGYGRHLRTCSVSGSIWSARAGSGRTCGSGSCPTPSPCEHPARVPPACARRHRRCARIHRRRPRCVLRGWQGPGCRDPQHRGRRSGGGGLSAETRAHNGSTAWRQIAGMRDKLIHEYFLPRLANLVVVKTVVRSEAAGGRERSCGPRRRAVEAWGAWSHRPGI